MVMRIVQSTATITTMNTDMSATVDTAIDNDAQQLLALLHLSSPALPIGAFAYSSGLESAIELGWVKTEAELQSWLDGMLNGLTHLDIPVLLRMCAARDKGDMPQVQYWSDFLRANRESHELLFEDEQLALALVRLSLIHI